MHNRGVWVKMDDQVSERLHVIAAFMRDKPGPVAKKILQDGIEVLHAKYMEEIKKGDRL